GRGLPGFDDAAGQAGAGVAGGPGGVVVRVGVHDHRLADDVAGAAVAQRGAAQQAVDRGHALVVGGDVVAVAGVVLAFAHASVRAGGRIEVAAGAGGVGGAAVAVLVHVEAMLAAGGQAGDFAGDADPAVHHGEFQVAGHRIALGGGQGGAGRGGGGRGLGRVGHGRGRVGAGPGGVAGRRLRLAGGQ